MQGRFNHWVRLVLASCLVVCLFFAGRVMGESAKGSWDSRFTLPPGLNGQVNAMVSLGNYLVVGGSFSRAGGVEARGVALWDGSRWWPLGSGVDGEVYALALSNDGLYVGGTFSHAGGKPANNIAKWNGFSWDSLNGGVQLENVYYSPSVMALYLQGGKVYVGGSFSKAGNIPASNIASWDGRAWHPLGAGVWLDFPGATGSIRTITGDGVNVYVGGAFAQAGDVFAANLARWNGRTWETIGSTAGGSVSALAYFQNNLYVGGDFYGIVIGDMEIDMPSFARWDGRVWHSISVGEGARLSLLKVEQGCLYVGGGFDDIGGVSAKNMAVLKNGIWSGMQVKVPNDENIQALTFVGNTLFVGGGFGLFNGKNVGHIVKLEQGLWRQVGSGNGNSLDNAVEGLALDGNNVYAAGFFQSAGTNSVTGLAKWDGVKWSPIAPTISGHGEQVAVVGSNIYVTGQFELPGIGSTTLAGWNGSEWSLLPGIDSDSSQYARLLKAGEILFRDGWVTGFAIEGFDGTNWNLVPWEQLNEDNKLATDGTNLFIARSSVVYDFQTHVARYDAQVAKWDGVNPEMVGGIIEGLHAEALAVSGQQVYLAGRWSTNYNHTVLFQWNGNQWRQIGGFSQQNGYVWSMVIMGRYLYVGGRFDSIAGVPVNNIAQWDGSKWRSLGSGLQDGGGAYGDGVVSSMVGSGGKLYVGGNFGTAGGKESGNFAAWTEAK